MKTVEKYIAKRITVTKSKRILNGIFAIMFSLTINIFSQTLSLENGDISIFDEMIVVDSTEMSVFGSIYVDGENSSIENNGDISFTAKKRDQVIQNNANDQLFAGLGNYAFLGDANHILTGRQSFSLGNVDLNKPVNSAIIVSDYDLTITNHLTLKSGCIDVSNNNKLIIENPSPSAIDCSFGYNESFVEGTLKRKVVKGEDYLFPIAADRQIYSLQITNKYDNVSYIESYFSKDELRKNDVALRTGITKFHKMDNTGAWRIAFDSANAIGEMNIKTFIGNLFSVNGLSDNQFRLLHNVDMTKADNNWCIDGEMALFGSPARLAGTDYTELTAVQNKGDFALAMSTEDKLVNIIAPNKGRETRFIVLGIDDYESTELVVYNLEGSAVFSQKPYRNELDFKTFNQATYYYVFRYKLNGKSGSIQSYVDVKEMD